MKVFEGDFITHYYETIREEEEEIVGKIIDFSFSSTDNSLIVSTSDNEIVHFNIERNKNIFSLIKKVVFKIETELLNFSLKKTGKLLIAIAT